MFAGAFAYCTVFALHSQRMKGFEIDLNKTAGRVGDGMADQQVFCSPFNAVGNLEPHPYADCHQPSRFHSPMECSHPAFNPHATNLKLVWRTL
jgi:hypothetical protein